MDDDTPQPRARSPKPDPTPGMSEAELSRIAREAVHQAPDSRLDKQLERMGLLDASEATGPQVAASAAPPGGGPATVATGPAPLATSPIPIDPELERLRVSLRRSRQMVWALAALAAILVIVVVVVLLR
jgi:hypothetical protein